ncbi:MAG: hypothetical protein RL215_2061, partial [Planctomycetota bacterium]
HLLRGGVWTDGTDLGSDRCENQQEECGQRGQPMQTDAVCEGAKASICGNEPGRGVGLIKGGGTKELPGKEQQECEEDATVFRPMASEKLEKGCRGGEGGG